MPIPAPHRLRPGAYSPLRAVAAASIALPLLMLAAVGVLVFRETAEAQFTSVEHSAEVLAEHALRTLRTQELLVDQTLLSVLDQPWPRLAADAQLPARLASMIVGQPDISAIVISNAEGTEVISNNGVFRTSVVGQRDYFRRLREATVHHPVLSGPVTGAVSGNRVFVLAKRRNDAGGNFVGIVSVAVRMEYFESLYAKLIRDPDDPIGMTLEDGTVIVRAPKLDKPLVLPPDSGFMRALRDAPRSGRFESRAVLDSVERMYAYRRAGEYPVYVSVARSRAGLWQEWRQKMLPYALVCAAAMALLLVAVLLARRYFRSEVSALRELSREAELRLQAEAAKAGWERDSRSKDAFLAALGHELRNPVGAIALAVEVLGRTTGKDSASARHALRILGNQTRHLSRLLEDMLDLANTVQGNLTLKSSPLELGAFARDLVESYSPAFGSSPVIEVAGGPAWVNADAARLQQILLNLLDNSCKYGAQRIRVEVGVAGGAAELRVSDDGDGIPAEILPQVFEPFVRGPNERNRPGFGLGLALIQRLVELHGGEFAGSSAGRGQGASFTVRLPAVPAPAERSVPVTPRAAPRPARILVVDDQQDARESLRLLLEAEGHRVTTAGSGVEALARLERERPEIVVCDIGMPGMDGFTFARAARATIEGRSALLVALSGYGARGDEAESRRAGFDHHLTKPATPADLASVFGAASSPRAADTGTG